MSDKVDDALAYLNALTAHWKDTNKSSPLYVLEQMLKGIPPCECKYCGEPCESPTNIESWCLDWGEHTYGQPPESVCPSCCRAMGGTDDADN